MLAAQSSGEATRPALDVRALTSRGPEVAAAHVRAWAVRADTLVSKQRYSRFNFAAFASDDASYLHEVLRLIKEDNYIVFLESFAQRVFVAARFFRFLVAQVGAAQTREKG